ncbi:MAG TPA: methyltransferase domain-containing protein [Nitrosopumilaceae archaeon]|nr:methyltransferase domain-containing protein [Nitrosopumilaceae archaeon]
MKKINLLDVFFWTFRRNEKDVVNLYDSLSDLMQLATGGFMLNFGFWDKTTKTPLDAQNNMCKIFGKIAKFAPNQHIVDVGSGLSSPAIQWFSDYQPAEITCVNINFKQLKKSIKNVSTLLELQNTQNGNFTFLNSTATMLPFEKESVDRVVSLESAQHFKPLQNFISESYRILKKNGILAMAIPVMLEKHISPIMKLGLLSMTWSSEHYSIDFVKSLIKQEGFYDIDIQKIGPNVYEQLARFYFENRDSIKSKISTKYPPYVENILFKSINKMNEVSQNKIIDYVLISCQK